jgi:hypothetical protein
VRARRVAYRADGWGSGELWLDGERLLWHEAPRAGAAGDEAHPLADRLRAFFAGEPVAFDDVELDLEWCTPFQLAVAETLRRVPRGEVVTYGELAALAGYPGASLRGLMAPLEPAHLRATAHRRPAWYDCDTEDDVAEASRLIEENGA